MKQATKSLSLRKPIADYFNADSRDGEAVSQCFTENAVVKDEGHTYKGRAAIKQWKTGTSTKYEYTSEPVACEESCHQPPRWKFSWQPRRPSILFQARRGQDCVAGNHPLVTLNFEP